MVRNRVNLALASLVLLTSLVVLWRFAPTGRRVSVTALPPAAPSNGGSEASSSDHLELTSQGRQSVPAQEAGTVRDILIDYWGKDSDRILRDAAEQGLDLEQSVESLAPWKEAQLAIRDRVVASSSSMEAQFPTGDSWPNGVSNENIAGLAGKEITKELTIRELAAIDSIAAPYAAQINALETSLYMQLGDAMVTQFDRGEYRRAPLFLPSNGETRAGLYGRSISTMGWFVELSITADDWPSIAQLKEELNTAKQNRLAEVISYIDSL